MNKVKDIWKWLSGKKTKIGAFGVMVFSWNFTSKHINPDAVEIGKAISEYLMYGGLLHSAYKGKDVIKNTVINNLNSMKNKVKPNK